MSTVEEEIQTPAFCFACECVHVGAVDVLEGTPYVGTSDVVDYGPDGEAWGKLPPKVDACSGPHADTCLCGKCEEVRWQAFVKEDGRLEREPWRLHYHSKDEFLNFKPASFLIKDFLLTGAITAIAAPVAQRKTLIAANIAESLVTGAPLFGHFAVVERPKRVLYLCPEMGISTLGVRFKLLGLSDYVGEKLFLQTLNSESPVALADLRDELPGAVVILDTAIRFMKGNENESSDMKVFADEIFRLLKAGALAVIILYHSKKGSGNDTALTLDNAMRGSGELAAFVSCCWATKLLDPEQPYTSQSVLKNVKQRDFETDPFTVTSDDTGRLTIACKPGEASVRVAINGGNKDGKHDEATAYVRSHIGLTAKLIVEGLKELGIVRSPAWAAKVKKDIKEALFAELQANGGKMPVP